MKKVIFLEVKGLHCPDCPSKVERSLSKMAGIEEVQIDYDTERGSVTFDNNLIGVPQIIKRISKMGFHAEEVQVNIH
ncbi:heavy-metal-associated domain-containing protein [Allobacillus sp. GCM10007491]|uniref:Copper chaperone CopZ n=1 Tax=Allobacillus saliphilus TaxID=2912308 RepID=A0A941CWW4_9BACI|nr:heavy metal-associated domain-containing protein [Allobacillus saliphilus]MBR7554661.1 heavy-metal-associated domain-containing protein [Allobacillus saliphilus]